VFDIFSQAMLYLLDGLKAVTGSYGWAIIAVTALLRVVLWPVNSSQTRSMKQMQALQPKFKQVQDQYKSDPQRMQQEMMKLYSEHKFNPMAGCLPMLIQLPIFIGLYSALSSPDFMIKAGHEGFGFIEHLYDQRQSYADEPLNGTFATKPNEQEEYHTGATATVYLKNGAVMPQKVDDPAKALLISPKPAIPLNPLTFKLPVEKLGLTAKDYLPQIDRVEVPVINQKSREIEVVNLKPVDGMVAADLPTVQGKDKWNNDVLILIGIYALLTIGYQQVMQKFTPKTTDGPPGQAQMMNIMTLMFVAMMFFIPMPAGVLLYLVVTMLFMFVQTLWVNMTDKSDKPAVTTTNPVPVTGRPTVIDIKS
jgi:YidC/Oxa1 family membrane protein insertase